MSYGTKTDVDRSVGTVRGRETRIYVIDVEASVFLADADADEIVIRLNGRPIKRMTMHAARRSGVVTEDAR
jgi:hypothetical protein